MREMLFELGDPNVKAPDGGELTVERTEVRVRACKSLARYGAALKALIGSKDREEIQTATAGLLSSLNAVDGVSISDKEAGAITQAVATVGGLFIENNRKRAVKQVVPAMHGPLSQMLAAMRASFATYGESGSLRWSAGHAAVVSDLRDAQTNISGVTADQQRRADALAAAKEERFKIASKEIGDSVETVLAAHLDLKNVLVSDEVTIESLQGFMAEIEQLVQTYEILSEQ
jgi:hypothetical protein